MTKPNGFEPILERAAAEAEAAAIAAVHATDWSCRWTIYWGGPPLADDADGPTGENDEKRI